MLHCVYHPIDDMRVVDDAERERLVASGVWFDSPAEARNYRSKVEEEIKLEPEPIRESKGKAKKEGKHHEKSSNG